MHTYTPFFFFPLAIPFFPFIFRFFPARATPLENVTADIRSYTVSHLHEGTRKLRKSRTDTVDYLIF